MKSPLVRITDWTSSPDWRENPFSSRDSGKKKIGMKSGNQSSSNAKILLLLKKNFKKNPFIANNFLQRIAFHHSGQDVPRNDELN